MSQRYPASIARLPMLALFEARGSEAGLGAALAAAGLDLPSRMQPVIRHPSATTVIRLGPSRLLIICEASGEAMLGAELLAAFDTMPDADVALVSDMFEAFDVSGQGAEDILSQGAPLDLSITGFPVGHAAATELWGTTAMLIRRDGEVPCFRIIVERSYAGFIEDWLIVASGGTSASRPGVMIAPPPSWKPA